MFTFAEVLPGIYHIRDAMDVCATLLTGTRRALLVDTGYGLEDIGAVVKEITPLPLTVFLTHGHHDHALGSRFFDEVCLLRGEETGYHEYTGTGRRKKVLISAAQRGIRVDEREYLASHMPPCRVIDPGPQDLGGLHAVILACPGHTPGSAVVYLPERKLLLTGDDWNPCTWLFFPEALDAAAYRKNMRALLDLPFDFVLCPHRAELYPRSLPEQFILGLTDAVLDAARPCDTGSAMGINTFEARLPGEQVLVFDRDKWKAPDDRA